MLRFPWANNDVMGVGGKNFVQHFEVGESLSAFITWHRAGSPTDESIYWLHLKPREIAQGFARRHNIVISYDIQRNEAYLSIGTNHGTANFIADNLLWWWGPPRGITLVFTIPPKHKLY